MNKSLEDSKNLVKRKASWILKKQLEYQSKQHNLDILTPTFENNSTLPYLGKNIKLAVFSYPRGSKLKLKNNQFQVYVETDNIDLGLQIRSVYEKWVKQQAIKILGAKILKFARVINVNPRKIVFKNLKNRWGSITKNGILNLNFNLVKAPDDAIDYAVIHELCHLMIKEHSHHYWELVKKYSSEYKTKIAWLETNGKPMVM